MIFAFVQGTKVVSRGVLTEESEEDSEVHEKVAELASEEGMDEKTDDETKIETEDDAEEKKVIEERMIQSVSPESSVVIG